MIVWLNISNISEPSVTCLLFSVHPNQEGIYKHDALLKNTYLRNRGSKRSVTEVMVPESQLFFLSGVSEKGAYGGGRSCEIKKNTWTHIPLPHSCSDEKRQDSYHGHVDIVWIAWIIIRTACCFSRFQVTWASNDDKDMKTDINKCRPFLGTDTTA